VRKVVAPPEIFLQRAGLGLRNFYPCPSR
jgi:hypothetical protein